MRNLNEEPGFRYDDSSSKKGLILNSKNELFFDKKLKLPNWKKKDSVSFTYDRKNLFRIERQWVIALLFVV